METLGLRGRVCRGYLGWGVQWLQGLWSGKVGNGWVAGVPRFQTVRLAS